MMQYALTTRRSEKINKMVTQWEGNSGNNKNKDRYGRLLRFVYVRELFVNLYLVKYGYTRTYKVPIEHEKEFEEAEKHAMKNRLGVWS